MSEKRYKKLYKDRKIRRTVDRQASQQSVFAIIGCGILFIIVLSIGDYYDKYPRLSVSLGALFLLVSVARLYSIYRFENNYARGPSRWRNQFLVLMYIHALLWTGFAISVIYTFGLDINGFLVVLLSVGLCALQNVSWAPYKKLNVSLLNLTLLPVAITLLALWTPQTAIVAFMVLVFYGVLVQQGERLNIEYWSRLEAHQDLQEKARDLSLMVGEAEKTARTKTDFLTNVTHEIRTPMTSVLGMLSLLEDTELSKEQKDLQHIAMQSGESLLTLIDNILDFSRVTVGNIVLDSVVFNLRRSIEEAFDILGPRAHAAGIELSYVYDTDIPLRVRGDPSRLMQVIQNLVDHTIKFVNEGEVIVSIHVLRRTHDEGLLRVHVSNQGPSLTPDQRAHLFEAFVSTETGKAHSGTGLGLAICKGLVECMHGDIGVLSDAGKGNTLWFTALLGISSQQSQRSKDDRCFREKRVLLVEIPVGLQQSLEHELGDLDMTIEAIDDYDRALQILRSSARAECAYDLVIMNHRLDREDDLKLSRLLSDDPLLKNVHQIILTTLAQRGSTLMGQYCKAHPRVVLLTKPVHRSSLYASLDTLFNKDRVAPTSPSKAAVDHAERNFRILLVEDNKVNQMVTQGMLKRLGYSVIVVNHGKEALGIMEDKPFDLVLMDCQMPELDGYETTEEIRRRERLLSRHVPIIAMTANAMDGDEARCLAAGMDDYLPKPVDMEMLDAKMRIWLQNDVNRDGIIDLGSRSLH